MSADEIPFYDPAVHTDPAELVRVELYSTSGAAFRQVDPVSYVIPQVRSFVERETAGGYVAASRADAIDEAERRREAAHVMAGRGDEFVPTSKTVTDPADEQVRPWPVLEED